MTIYRTLLMLGALALPLSACSNGPADPYDTDSQSHWLQSCVDDTDCGSAYSCQCNVCVRTCAAGPDTCSDTLTATVCVPPSAQAAQVLCASTLAVDICLPPCTSCPDGWVCAGDACVPEEGGFLDIGLDLGEDANGELDSGEPDSSEPDSGEPDGGEPDGGVDPQDMSGVADSCSPPPVCEGGTSLRRVPRERPACDQYTCVEDTSFDCPGANGDTCDSIDDVCLTTLAGPPPEDGGSGRDTSCTPIPIECDSDPSCACVQAAFPGSDCTLDMGAFFVTQALP